MAKQVIVRQPRRRARAWRRRASSCGGTAPRARRAAGGSSRSMRTHRGRRRRPPPRSRVPRLQSEQLRDGERRGQRRRRQPQRRGLGDSVDENVRSALVFDGAAAAARLQPQHSRPNSRRVSAGALSEERLVRSKTSSGASSSSSLSAAARSSRGWPMGATRPLRAASAIAAAAAACQSPTRGAARAGRSSGRAAARRASASRGWRWRSRGPCLQHRGARTSPLPHANVHGGACARV